MEVAIKLHIIYKHIISIYDQGMCISYIIDIKLVRISKTNLIISNNSAIVVDHAKLYKQNLNRKSFLDNH